MTTTPPAPSSSTHRPSEGAIERQQALAAVLKKARYTLDARDTSMSIDDQDNDISGQNDGENSTDRDGDANANANADTNDRDDNSNDNDCEDRNSEKTKEGDGPAPADEAEYTEKLEKLDALLEAGPKLTLLKGAVNYLCTLDKKRLVWLDVITLFVKFEHHMAVNPGKVSGFWFLIDEN